MLIFRLFLGGIRKILIIYRLSRNKKFSVRGFSLTEILFTAAILVFGLCGLLAVYLNLFVLTDLSRDFIRATNSLQARIEDIKRTSFDDLSDLDGDIFDLDGFSAADSEGVIEVTDTAYTDLRRIRVIASFRSRGRLTGEDTNLNGALNVGEDTNNNGRLDSPAEIVTLISR